MKLEEYEEICPRCQGQGLISNILSSAHGLPCLKCRGTGKLDWLENIFGKKKSFENNIYAPYVPVALIKRMGGR